MWVRCDCLNYAGVWKADIYIIAFANELSISTTHNTDISAIQSCAEDIKFIQITEQY